MITYVNPAVAIALGALVLNEPLTHRHGPRISARDRGFVPGTMRGEGRCRRAFRPAAVDA